MKQAGQAPVGLNIDSWFASDNQFARYALPTQPPVRLPDLKLPTVAPIT